MSQENSATQTLCSTQLAQKSAIDEGFAWPHISGAFEKVREELDELEEAFASGHRPHTEIELGDLLFAVTCLATYLQADADQELRAATDRFQKRYHNACKLLDGYGKSLKECSSEELEHAWIAGRPSS